MRLALPVSSCDEADAREGTRAQASGGGWIDGVSVLRGCRLWCAQHEVIVIAFGNKYRHDPNAMNRWSIPAGLEHEVRQRDQECVYCRVPMLESPPLDKSRKNIATWEHIINDATIITRENIARCCASCNSSKGTKKLSIWIESRYCQRRGINRDTVADVVKRALTGDAG